MTKESNIGVVTATIDITSDDEVTPAISLLGLTPVAIIMPAGWDAAALTFQAADTDGNFLDMYDDDGVEVSVDADADRHIRLVPSEWVNIKQLIIRSGTTGTPVSQSADRTFTILTRNY